MIELLTGIVLLTIGAALIATRELSSQLHELWNSQFRWTQWATGPNAIQVSQLVSVVVGLMFIVVGLGFLVMTLLD